MEIKYLKIYNGTSHAVSLFNHTFGDRKGNCTIAEETKADIIIPREGPVLNCHSVHEEATEMGGIKLYKARYEVADPLPRKPYDIILVSSRYGEALRWVSTETVCDLDRVYTVDGLVKNKEGKIIGSNGLRKFFPVFWPSSFVLWIRQGLTPSKISLQLAVKNFLSLGIDAPGEYAALKELERLGWLNSSSLAQAGVFGNSLISTPWDATLKGGFCGRI